MIQTVGFRGPQVASPRRLTPSGGASVAIPHGTEVKIAEVELHNNLCPVLESLYYDGSAGGTGYLRFRVKLDGEPLPYGWADSKSPRGSAGNPAPVGVNLPPGRKLQLWVANEHASDDTLVAYCDGEVYFYDQPLP